jgi:hypothetical protein
MDVIGAARLFACHALWRATRMKSAGRVLVQALGSDDENIRTIAGMFLVRAGVRSEQLLQEALDRRENLPIVLAILADIGNRRFEPELRQFTEDEDPQVAKAARDALRILSAHR